MIYAIRAEGTKHIKFGRATSVGKRLSGLNTSSVHELYIDAVADWPDEEEKAIHKHLAEDHIRGEWFRESLRTIKLIGWMKEGRKGYKQWLKMKDLSQSRGWLISQWRSSPKSSTQQLKATDAVHQFMQSLMTWESNTLLSIATSLNTERQSGETLR